MSEQRQYPRAPIALEIRYQRTNAFIADYTKDISKGGIFVETEEPFNPGTVFDFDVFVPGRTDGMKLRGRVKWVKKASVEGLLGMGIEFVWVDDDARERFEKVVEAIVVESLGQAVYDRLASKS